MPKINIREQDPRKYEAVKAEQDKLKAICGSQIKVERNEMDIFDWQCQIAKYP